MFPGQDEAWQSISVRHVRIVTAAVAGGISVRGQPCAYLVRDAAGVVPDIAVRTAADLREFLPALCPASVEFDCTDDERPALVEFVHLILHDRRAAEARH